MFTTLLNEFGIDEFEIEVTYSEEGMVVEVFLRLRHQWRSTSRLVRSGQGCHLV
jgi:hypothetical protein